MSDLIERLRAAPYKVESWNIALYTEAAERIENLEAQRRVLQEQLAAALMTGSDRDAVEQPCRGCGKPLLIENAWMEDGCPCNTPAGVNNKNLYRWKLLHDLQQNQSRELAAALKAKEPRIYKACPKHQGLWWNFPATVANPAVDVCPHCEQEAMKK